MIFGDTIVACATPPGRSARAMVRVSGCACRHIASRLLETERDSWCAGAIEAGLILPRDEQCGAVHGPSGDLRLAVRVIISIAPRSYTGEDTLEIILPGNPTLVERVIDALCAEGDAERPIRRAEAGEFSARAYLHGKLTIEEAEGVSATITAGNEAELLAARRAMRGDDAKEWRAWTDEAAMLLALVEAGIDFTDQEDVVAITTAELSRRAAALRAQIASTLGGERAAAVARHVPRVALAGRPNAGKSTLLNALLGRRRAVVSAVAGTTRDVLVEGVDLSRLVPGGPEIELVDMAGLEPGEGSGFEGGHSVGRAVEREMRSRALAAIDTADVVLWCDPDGRFDAADGISPGAQAAVVRVRTKADRVWTRSGSTGLGRADESDVVPVCALDGWNLASLAARIADAAAGSRASAASGAGQGLLARHRRALAEAEGALSKVAALGEGEGRDDAAVAAALRAALDALGSITGRLSPDDVLGLVFARFCVGK